MITNTTDRVLALIEASADRHPARTALLAPGLAPLTYADLSSTVSAFAGQLRDAGIRRHDRVALVMPDGQDMALAFLGVVSAATAAPLNPAYRAAELRFYFGDLRPRAVLVPADSGSGVVEEVAAEFGIPVQRVRLGPTPGRRLELADAPASGGAGHESPAVSDIALILHTSGTTSRPKMVPLTQRNLAASAGNVAGTLRLEPGDRCLNVMPLFHIHGLVAGLLASLSAGASVVCSPGFSAAEFFGWMREFEPTWYTAVPTMHQAILAKGSGTGIPARLRFIRSSSSALPPRVMTELETMFGAPVIEAYGMTEASHQMASNPLPPEPRKPGTVGRPAGADMAILGEDGVVSTRADAAGEVVIRGAGVTSGYVENPAANAVAFVDGWFRTGDQGRFDSDGYLTITGRLKEIVNRGGEKIAPREIDEALLSHEAVLQAVAFGMPDARLGEEVAAAVVLRAAGHVTEEELQHHVAERLAPFKVPRRIVFVEAIPKGPTGKVQRIGLAAALGLAEHTPTAGMAPSAPRAAPETERRIQQLWQEVLRRPEVGLDEHFLDVGGDSLELTRLIGRLNDAFDIELGFVDLFDAATVCDQARVVERVRGR